MTLKKAHLFIDGSNFYHGLKQNNLFNKFAYRPFFDSLSKQFEITCVYFYDAIKNIEIEKEQYSKQQQFHEKLRKEIPHILIQTRKLKYLFANEKLERAQQNAAFCKDCAPKLKNFLKDAGLQKISKEKGIDIMLVTDMLKGAFQDRYQITLLATGDADYIPAVELVQTLKKEVINLHFYAGSSGELRNACNNHKLIQLDAEGNCFFR